MPLWLCISVSLSFSSKAVDCSTDTTGLCTPTIEEIIDEVITETIEFENGGITTTTTTETTTTTTTVTNEDSGNILDSENDFVTSSKDRSEEHTSELQSRLHLVCRLLLEKKKKKNNTQKKKKKKSTP